MSDSDELANDPWQEAKKWIEQCRGATTDVGTKRQIAYVDHLAAEIDRLTARVAKLEESNSRLAKASEIYRDASWQSHSGHWDDTRQGGRGCPECVRASKLRDEADKLMKGGK